MTSPLATFERDMVVRATKVALVVGTVLTIINQGGALAGGPMTVRLTLRIGLTYLVPFLVSLYSMLGTAPEWRPGSRSGHGGVFACRSCSGAVTAWLTVAPGERLPECARCGPAARWVPRHE